MTTSPTLALARFVLEARPADLPIEVAHEAKRAILNWVGCAIGAKTRSPRSSPSWGHRRPASSDAASASTSCMPRCSTA